jgi:hypothetical protein
MRANFSNLRTNRGSVLAISLTILTAITLISITALQRSGLQGRMVGNIQHQEQGFHAANGELEEIYQFYATQASATEALSLPLNSSAMVNGEEVFQPVAPGHTSTYNSHSTPLPAGHAPTPRLQVTSNIQHTGSVNSLVEDFSVGSFLEYGFIVNAQSTKPNIGLNPRDTLSIQEIGVTYIGPSS